MPKPGSANADHEVTANINSEERCVHQPEGDHQLTTNINPEAQNVGQSETEESNTRESNSNSFSSPLSSEGSFDAETNNATPEPSYTLLSWVVEKAQMGPDTDLVVKDTLQKIDATVSLTEFLSPEKMAPPLYHQKNFLRSVINRDELDTPNLKDEIKPYVANNYYLNGKSAVRRLFDDDDDFASHPETDKENSEKNSRDIKRHKQQ